MIYIENNYDKFDLTEGFMENLNNVVIFALKEEEIEFETEISITLVDNEEIKEINNRTRNIDKATDVLSFPSIEYEQGAVFKEIYDIDSFDDSYFDGEALVVGDIVLSLDKCRDQAEEYGHSFQRESCYLVVHSILHLLGYDHMNDEEKTKMRKREEEILNKLKITRL